MDQKISTESYQANNAVCQTIFFLASNQTLIKGKECFIDFVNTIILLQDKIFNDYVKFAGMRQGKSCFHQHILNFRKRKLKCQRKCKNGRFGWLVVLVIFNLGK